MRKLYQSLILQEKRIGLQVTVAINAAPTFANRNTLGITRFEYLVEYLNLWAEQQREITIDDLSLITNSGLHQIHLKDVTSWQTAFLSYEPVLKDTVPSPDLLGQAVDIALGYNSDSLVGKAILYITPLPESELGASIKRCCGSGKPGENKNIRLDDHIQSSIYRSQG